MGNFFGNLNGRFQSFMMGRNGSDKLARWSLGAACIVILINLFIPNPILMAISYALLFYSLYRTFSRNVAARQAENAKFESFMSGLGSKDKASSGSTKSSSSDKAASKGSASGQKGVTPSPSKAKVRFTCDSCGQSLSVPKGRGKLKVTCPKCHHQMTIDS